jgi:hypothetical protein
MDSLTFTFDSLKGYMSARLRSGLTIAPSSGANLLSALNGFMSERGFSGGEVIASSLRASYRKNVTQHVETLKLRRRSSRYVSNRKSLLTQWRRALLEADRASATGLGRESPLQCALRELLSAGRRVRGTALATGVPLATLKRWLDGATPNSRSTRWLPRIENHFAIPAGTLTDLLPQGIPVLDKGIDIPAVANQYRERLRWQSKECYAVKNASEDLRRQWREYVAYKTSAGFIRRSSDRQPLRRHPRGRWSTTLAPVKPNIEANWYAFQGPLYVATADIDWTLVSQYLGWLMLPEKQGGCSLAADEAMSLANFARDDLIEKYMNWRIARSGSVKHGGLQTFLTFVSGLCNPRTGYLTQNWQLFSNEIWVSSEADWSRRCSETFEQAAELRGSFKDEGQPSRDSKEAIGPALNLPNPLEAVADAIARLDAARPATGGVNEAVWARDRLLIKLLASNPLRDKNVRMLRFNPDGSGHLRKVDGVWRIAIDKAEFKNARGAAKHRTYDMAVRPEVWPDIERYIRDYRPMLCEPANVYFFVSARKGNSPMASLGRRFALLTKMYLRGCAGVGPHAMRHIVATSILKANPNDWAGAAWVLHDLPITVERHYAHLRSDDSSRWVDKTMSGPFSRM